MIGVPVSHLGFQEGFAEKQSPCDASGNFAS